MGLNKKIDFLIIGAGISGVITAYWLKQRGYEVVLVERLKYPRKVFKGELLQPRAVSILNDFCLDTQILENHNKIKELNFKDYGSHENIISELNMTYIAPTYAASLSSHQLSSNLFKFAKKHLGVHFWPGTHVAALNSHSDDFHKRPIIKATSEENGEVIFEPRWVIACDGKNSSVRKWLFESKEESHSPSIRKSALELIVGAEIKHDHPQIDRYDVIRTSNRGTASFFCLEKQLQRAYFNVKMPLTASQTKQEIQNSLLDLYAQNKNLQAYGDIEFSAVQAAVAQTVWLCEPIKGRFIFIGDSQSVTTPFGGQGITSALLQVKGLLEGYSFEETSYLKTRSMNKDYTNYVNEQFKRTNIINFFLYNLFFTKGLIAQQATAAMVLKWNQEPEVKEEVIRFFSGYYLEAPTIKDIFNICGFIKPPSFLRPLT